MPPPRPSMFRSHRRSDNSSDRPASSQTPEEPEVGESASWESNLKVLWHIALGMLLLNFFFFGLRYLNQNKTKTKLAAIGPGDKAEDVGQADSYGMIAERSSAGQDRAVTAVASAPSETVPAFLPSQVVVKLAQPALASGDSEDSMSLPASFDKPKQFQEFLRDNHLDDSACMEQVAELIENGFDVNFVDENGFPPLFAAIIQKKLHVAELLLCYGANAKFIARDKFQRTALLCLMHFYKSETEKSKPVDIKTEKETDSLLTQLLASGVGLNTKDETNRKAIHYAINFGKLPWVKKLFGRGATLTYLEYAELIIFTQVTKNKAMEEYLTSQRDLYYDCKTLDPHTITRRTLVAHGEDRDYIRSIVQKPLRDGWFTLAEQKKFQELAELTAHITHISKYQKGVIAENEYFFANWYYGYATFQLGNLDDARTDFELTLQWAEALKDKYPDVRAVVLNVHKQFIATLLALHEDFQASAATNRALIEYPNESSLLKIQRTLLKDRAEINAQRGTIVNDLFQETPFEQMLSNNDGRNEDTWDGALRLNFGSTA